MMVFLNFLAFALTLLFVYFTVYQYVELKEDKWKIPLPKTLRAIKQYAACLTWSTAIHFLLMGGIFTLLPIFWYTRMLAKTMKAMKNETDVDMPHENAVFSIIIASIIAFIQGWKLLT